MLIGLISYEMGKNETKRLKNRTAAESVTGCYSFITFIITLELKFIVIFIMQT